MMQTRNPRRLAPPALAESGQNGGHYLDVQMRRTADKNRSSKVAISNVALAVDFSAESAQAVGCARRVYENYKASLHIVNVMDLFPFSLRDDAEATRAVKEIRRMAEAGMKAFVHRFKLAGTEFDTTFLSGEPSAALEQFIRQSRIDLVVLGSRGDKGLRRLFEGSMAEEIFRNIQCPVMVAGPKARPASGKFRHLLFATDMSDVSRAAVPYLEFLLDVNPSAKVTIAHFLDGEDSDIYSRHRLRRNKERELAEMLPPELRSRIANIAVEVSAPADGMISMAQGVSADLLVLGVRSGGSFTRAATHEPFSIAPRVISEAACPVLTVRAQAPALRV